jgi:pimeloyl-ACP methyl ester carboxylesterase
MMIFYFYHATSTMAFVAAMEPCNVRLRFLTRNVLRISAEAQMRGHRSSGFFETACGCFCAAVMSAAIAAPGAHAASTPKAPGALVDLGGHKLHVNCTGKGSPTVVVENGLGDFSFDWILVQDKVAAFTRICTYDRAGYAWSDPGPKPRTFAQLNLELRDALTKLGEHGPFVVVGHSYGGPVVRNFALTYPHEVAGLVFVDAAYEGQRVGIGAKATMRLGADAKGKSIPSPHEEMRESDKPGALPAPPEQPEPLDPLYNALPEAEQKLQLWAQALPKIADAEMSQMEWSSEYFAKWLVRPQAGSLGATPVIVLTRAEGGYDDSHDVPGAQMEKERKEGQAMLAKLSTNSKQIIVHSGHNMELEAPAEVSAAIREIVEVVRGKGRL